MYYSFWLPLWIERLNQLIKLSQLIKHITTTTWYLLWCSSHTPYRSAISFFAPRMNTNSCYYWSTLTLNISRNKACALNSIPFNSVHISLHTHTQTQHIMYNRTSELYLYCYVHAYCDIYNSINKFLNYIYIYKHNIN